MSIEVFKPQVRLCLSWFLIFITLICILLLWDILLVYLVCTTVVGNFETLPERTVSALYIDCWYWVFAGHSSPYSKGKTQPSDPYGVGSVQWCTRTQHNFTVFHTFLSLNCRYLQCAEDCREEYLCPFSANLKYGNSQLRCAEVKGVSPGPRQLRWCNTPAPAAENMKQYCDRNGSCGLEGKICMGGLMLVLTVLVTFIFFAPDRCIRHLKGGFHSLFGCNQYITRSVFLLLLHLSIVRFVMLKTC